MEMSQKERHDHDELYRRAFERAAVGMAHLSNDGQWLAINAALCDLLGYSEKELRALTLDALTHPDDLGLDDSAVVRFVTGSQSNVRTERRYRHKQGHYVWASVTKTRMEPNGHPGYVLAVVQDVSSRKSAEAALREQEERLRRVVSQIPGLVWVTDCDLRFTLTGGGLLPKFDGVPNARVGELVYDYVGTRDPEALPIKAHLQALAGQTVEHEDTWFGRQFRFHMAPLRNEAGEITGCIGIGFDETDRKATEAAYKATALRLELLLREAPVLLWTTDEELTVVSSAGAGLKQVGIESLDGLPVRKAFRRKSATDAHEQALRGGSSRFDLEWHGRYFYSHVEPIIDENRNITGVSGFALDATELRYLEQTLRLSEKRYRDLFARNLAGVFRSTSAGRLLECNESFARILGFESPEQALAVPMWELYYDRADRERLIRTLRETGELVNFELTLRKRNGLPIWILLNETITDDPKSGEAILEGTIIDITDRKLAEEQVQHQAYHDPLTDLPNRLLFRDRLTVALARARRSSRSVGVVFVDLDHFKLVNDTLGHTAGDELLRNVAERLQALLRTEDTVARIGGDEFTIILPELKNDQAPASLARKLLECFAPPFTVNGREIYVTASIGIAIFPNDGDSAETLVKNADIAMYRAKELGRNNFQFYTPVAQKRAEQRLTLETELRHAIEREEFVLHFQPQVCLKCGTIAGAEALIRWEHPDRGLVPPLDFIPIAEELGLIVPIGEWVLQSLCVQAKNWQAVAKRSLRFACNLSARQLQHPLLVHSFERIVSASGIEPSSLDFEITESIAMRDPEATLKALQKFRKIGMRLSMDDFGTGYSSLSQLKHLPIDHLKIDRSLINEIDHEKRDAAIVDAAIKMGHSLGLRVIAEGVESCEQIRILSALRCDEVQGYIFSRPVAASEFEQMLGEAMTFDIGEQESA